MFVIHDEFGEGHIINSTEVLDEEGNVISADVMFEHGIETGLALVEIDEAEDKLSGLSPAFKAAAERGKKQANRGNYGVGGGARDKFHATPKFKMYKVPTKEEVEQVDEKLVGDQHKIDANKNGKVDGNDFDKLRDRKEVKESVEPKVTPATASLRPSAGAASLIRNILGEHRDVRKEATIKEFESRKK